ncbi:exported hypothetical protein [uncultured Stenotrophomonas sp.]|uniref:Secreted protein n=1 Tax=uncultured Stenotrophomonas sp. TaxID=165438 RepID=A0A1Y5Q4W6_9GAMM|nr:exported hypothetical protein [uncultured Stenotrophomonas sp.]
MTFPSSLSRWLLAGLLLALPGMGHADSWVPPSLKVVSSTNGQALVRMTPGGFQGDKRPDVELYAYDVQAKQYNLKTRFQLRNRLAPVEMLLTEQGELVTLDEWTQVGHGTVLVVYAADGAPRLQLDLEQLLGEQAAAKAPASVSSIWWRCRKPWLGRDDGELVTSTYDNGELRVELATGKVQYTPGNGRCE